MNSEEERPLAHAGFENALLVVEKPLGLLIRCQIPSCQDECPDTKASDRFGFSGAIAKTPILRQDDQTRVATVLEPPCIGNVLIL